MRNQSPLKFAIILLALVIIPFESLWSYTSYSLLFLNIPNGVRETGMGETGVSHANSGAAGWWNPAHLATTDNQIDFQVFRWIADSKGSFGSSRFATSWGGVGAYYFYQGIDGFEIRDRPGDSQGTFSLYQSLFAVGTGFNLSHGLKFGMVYKLVYENIYSSFAQNNHALDLGLKLERGPWTAGLALSNVELLNRYAEPLPTSWRFGVSNQRKITVLDCIVSLELLNLRRGDSYVNFGVEAGWQERLFFRAGYMTGYDSRDVSFGIGVKHLRYRADISITPFTNDLGTVWRAGLGFNI